MNKQPYPHLPLPATTLFVVMGLGIVAGCSKQQSADQNADATAVTSANVSRKVEQARTPAEHLAVAEYYEAQARLQRRAAGEGHPQGPQPWGPDDHMMGSRGAGARDDDARAAAHRQSAAQTRDDQQSRE